MGTHNLLLSKSVMVESDSLPNRLIRPRKPATFDGVGRILLALVGVQLSDIVRWTTPGNRIAQQVGAVNSVIKGMDNGLS